MLTFWLLVDRRVKRSKHMSLSGVILIVVETRAGFHTGFFGGGEEVCGALPQHRVKRSKTPT